MEIVLQKSISLEELRKFETVWDEKDDVSINLDTIQEEFEALNLADFLLNHSITDFSCGVLSSLIEDFDLSESVLLKHLSLEIKAV